MTYRRRTYPEVLENLLTSITDGVAAESHPFPPAGAKKPPYKHSLLRPPVDSLVAVYGSRGGAPHLFRPEKDYALDKDQRTLVWQEKAELPDAGTLVAISYYPKGTRPVVTDIETGSIVRTLSESLAKEIAGLYAQLETVYESAFIDTATGSALDKVVALLGIDRVRAGLATGEIELTRAESVTGAISVPAGTRVITTDGDIEYETTGAVTLAPGQKVIRAPVRDLEANDPVAADSLTVLPLPIAGIAAVNNPAPTAIANRDESDEELRERAKSFLAGSEKATLGALDRLFARENLKAEITEVKGKPGVVQISPRVATLPPEQEQRLRSAIQATRPAGVEVSIVGLVPPRKVDLDLHLTTAEDMIEQDRRAAHRAVRTVVEAFFSDLPAKKDGSLNRLVGGILEVDGVTDVRLLKATWTVAGTTTSVLEREKGLLALAGHATELGTVDIADPGLPSALSATVRYPEGQPPPDQAAIEAALTAALTYLNDLNATEIAAGLPAAQQQAEEGKRRLSFGKLLRVTPLPGKPAKTLETFDQPTAEEPSPTLPAKADVEPYVASFVIAQESGLTVELAGDGDSYALTPFERLALAGVEIAKVKSGG